MGQKGFVIRCENNLTIGFEGFACFQKKLPRFPYIWNRTSHESPILSCNHQVTSTNILFVTVVAISGSDHPFVRHLLDDQCLEVIKGGDHVLPLDRESLSDPFKGVSFG